jgi:hypothetical protein
VIALMLLAQIASAPVPLPAPVRLESQAGGATTLSDYARGRKLCADPAGCGTFSVTGAPGMPVLLSPVYGEGGSFAAVDAADAAHRPVESPAQAVTGWPYVVTGYGYGWQTRHVVPHGHAAALGRRAAPPPSASAIHVAPPLRQSFGGYTSAPQGRTTRGAGKRPH